MNTHSASEAQNKFPIFETYMCDISCIFFAARQLRPSEVAGRRILEVGSYDVNGSIRRIWETWEPTEYVGVDIISGPGVDIVCSSDDIVTKFGENRFDIVVSTEMLEHARNWRVAISNIKRICKCGGVILITTRSFGGPYHSWPYDFWRYEKHDMKAIFSDYEILVLESDTNDPGVFLKARKPIDFRERDLSQYELYNIVSGRRCIDISPRDYRTMRYLLLRSSVTLKRTLKPAIRRLFGRLGI